MREDLDLGKGLAVLTEDAVKKVAIPNPKLAPYGREAVRALAHHQVYGVVEPKLVYAENISQATQYIDTQAADVGFTAKSLVLSPELHGQGKWVEVPTDSYQRIAQAAVILRYGDEHHRESAKRFFDFLYSEKARAIFVRMGYVLP
jgi:molybdate transport system substrate-binding protein